MFKALSITALAAALALAGPAMAQNYPERQVRILVGVSAGGTTDALARLFADHLSQKSGQTVIVENITGAGGNTASNAVVNAAPDGYTLLMGSTGNIVINQFLYDTMTFDPLTDLDPIAHVTEAEQYLSVSRDVPVDDIEGLLELARERPGEITYASAGVGSTTHLGVLLLENAAGVEFLHVPYGGAAPAVGDVAAGRVDMVHIGMSLIQDHIANGDLRPLVVAAPERFDALPDVPSAVEAGVPEYEMLTWFGLFAPAGTPPEIIAYLNEAANEMLADPARQPALNGMMLRTNPMSPEAFAELLQREAERYGTVIEAVGIVME